ncbi:MAG TPA: ABC transporter substrate-binding protein [Candidatus Dormibacteraeota bacterium]|nr:ABC transporter substrate-binding protein [Candidatus Dormibacteraeota bacterium]
MHLSAASAKLAAALVVLAACGTTSTATNATTVTKEPHRIVSLSPTATEMLFAIDAGPQVVAVDDQSNFPANAPMTKLSGFQPNVEAIVAYKPDLVVAADDTGGIVHALGQLSIATLIEPAAHNLEDSYAQIDQLGAATGHVPEAQALVKKMRAEIAKATSLVAKPSRPLKVYHELDDTYYSATSKTFIGQVYQLLGLTNIADGATGAAADYPQLSSEYIVSSNPDLIVLADTKCCRQDVSSVGARPGWSGIAAVKSGQVIGVDDDIASRWGPRVVDFLITVSAHVAQLEQQAA